jgi:signal transduction histidine kinase
MHGRVQRMEALVDGMLAYARATKKETSRERIDVGRLVKEVVELLDPPARVTIHIDPTLPTVEAERVPFQQVVMNLLSNAIKHGRADAPRSTSVAPTKPTITTSAWPTTDPGFRRNPGIESGSCSRPSSRATRLKARALASRW